MKNQTLQQDKYRVAVYDADEVGQNACRTTGMIVAKHENGALLFLPDLPIGKREWWVHPKQCRRLKKRDQRRRIWIDTPDLRDLGTTEGSQGTVFVSTYSMPRAVEFVEVRKK